MSGDLNVFDKRVGDKPARVLYVRLPLSFVDLAGINIIRLNANRARRKRSPRHSRRPLPRRPSLSAPQTGEFSLSRTTTSTSAGMHTRVLSPAWVSHLLAPSTLSALTIVCVRSTARTTRELSRLSLPHEILSSAMPYIAQAPSRRQHNPRQLLWAETRPSSSRKSTRLRPYAQIRRSSTSPSSTPRAPLRL